MQLDLLKSADDVAVPYAGAVGRRLRLALRPFCEMVKAILQWWNNRTKINRMVDREAKQQAAVRNQRSNSTVLYSLRSSKPRTGARSSRWQHHRLISVSAFLGAFCRCEAVVEGMIWELGFRLVALSVAPIRPVLMSHFMQRVARAVVRLPGAPLMMEVFRRND